ncbi:Uncharacterized protein PCOAH_00009670 [Plasmodium coatneyi]|uniref:SUZ domain-containing protein n=1 Tax=Plasmodium coatneyi TaxID=208452 RepID=A0A1B1DUT0_9APIC|nr:Uncharacterized protein PCOAH_00009670 [Plasmodium coatneyi]ANQ06538.1 Uncharacterized protein PCOAH_00009670 [Plasmodium coatneyi]
MMSQSGKISGPDTSHMDTSCPSSKDAINEKSETQPEDTTQRNSIRQHKNGTLAFATSNFSNERSNVTMVHEEGTNTYDQFVVELPSKTDTNPKVVEAPSETHGKGTSPTNAGEKRKSQPPNEKMTSTISSTKTYAERVTHEGKANETGVNETKTNDDVVEKDDNPVTDEEEPQLGRPASDSQNFPNEKKKKKRKKKKKKGNTPHGVRNAPTNESMKEQAKGESSLQYDSWHEVDDPSNRNTPTKDDNPNGSDSLRGDTQRGKDPTSVDMPTNEDTPTNANHNRKNPPDGWPKKKITLLKRNEMKYEKYTGGGNYPIGSTPTGGKNWHQDTSQKTLEQREKEYRKIRARIFSNFNKKKNSLKLPDDCMFKDCSNGMQDANTASHFAMPVGSPYGAPANNPYGAMMNSTYDTAISNVYSCAMSGLYGTNFCNLPPSNHDGHLYTHNGMHLSRMNAANDVPPPPPSFFPTSQTVYASYMYDMQNQSSFSKTGSPFPFPTESNANCYPHYKNINFLPGRRNLPNRGKAQMADNCTKGDVGKDNLVGMNQYELNSGRYNSGTYMDGVYTTGTYNNDGHNNGLYACGLQSGIPPSDPMQGTALMNHPKQNSLTNITHVDSFSQIASQIKLPNVGRTTFKGNHFTSLSKNMNQDVCKKNKPPMDKRINNSTRKKGANGIHHNVISAEVPRQMDFLHGGMENIHNSATVVSGGSTSRRKKKENIRGDNVSSSASANACTMKNTNLVNTPPLNFLTNDMHPLGNINQKTTDHVESAKGRRIQPGAPPFNAKGETHPMNQQSYCTDQSAVTPEEQLEQHTNEEGALGEQTNSKREQKNACPVQVNVPNEAQGLPPPPPHYNDSRPGRDNQLGGAKTTTNDSKDTHINVTCSNEGGKNGPPPNLDDMTDNAEPKGKKKRNAKRKKKKNAQGDMAKGTVTTMGSSIGPPITTVTTTPTNGPMPSTTFLQKYKDPLLAIDELEYCRDITLYERRFDRGNNTLENTKRYDVDFPSLY